MQWFLFIVLIACSQQSIKKKPEPKPPLIDLSETVKIAFLPYLNHSGLQTFKEWPIRQKHIDMLHAYFDSIDATVQRSVGLHSPFNRLHIVHQSERPDYRMQLVFQKASASKKGWKIPFKIRVFDQKQPDKNFEIGLVHYGLRPLQKKQPKGYILWNYVLKDYKNRFPHQEILIKLFSPRP